MKIKENGKQIKLLDVCNGGVFKHKNDYYIKTEECEITHESTKIVVINLIAGNVKKMEDQTMVEIVKCVLKIR